MKYNKLIIYTDGSCKGNPGPGGWAYLIINQQLFQVSCLSGGEKDTTNNRMEMMALIKALEDKSLEECESVEIFSDSSYLINGIKQDWISNWKQKGWKNSSKQPVANRDLWEKIDSLVKKFKIEFKYIKGHSGNPYNDMVDKLAGEQAITF